MINTLIYVSIKQHMAQSAESSFLLPVISIVGGLAASIITVFLTSRQERRKSKEDARREYEYEARKRLYLECEPILFQLRQLSEVAKTRISHLPVRMREHTFLDEAQFEEKNKEPLSMKDSARTTLTGDEEEIQKDKLGWLSFPNYYMISTIYILLAPMATFKILQDRLTTVDLELDPFIKKIYILSKHIYLSLTAQTEMLKIAEKNGSIIKQQFGQGIYAGYLDNAIEGLIKDYNEPDKISRIKSFGEFNRQYILEAIWTGNNEKVIQPPFSRIYALLRFFLPKDKPILLRILLEQLYLYNAITEIYDIREEISGKPNSHNNENVIAAQLRMIKPIKGLTEDQLDEFNNIPEDKLDKNDSIKKWLEDVIQHLREQPELKDLIDKNATVS